MQKTIRTLFFIALCCGICFSSPPAYAASNSTIDATIKISICGNAVAEGGEDCDGSDMQGKSCSTIGRGNGTLRCDISCEFDTSACSVTTLSSTTSEEETIETPLIPATVQPENSPLFPTLLTISPTFPKGLLYFGADSNGTIARAKLKSSVQLWVTEWQDQTQTCDVNADQECSLVDLSVMLYYVQP